MSHRKFEAPRHGSLGFLPRKRTRRARPHIRHFPKDEPTAKPHLTAFMGYKAGMTHIVRELDKPGSAMNKKDVVEAVTILETPPMVVVGIVGYIETPLGLKSLGTVWAQHLSYEAKRRLQKNWFHSKKNCYKKHMRNYLTRASRVERAVALKRMARSCTVIRVIAHTQIRKLPQLKTKSAHITEIRINGGNVPAKINFAVKLLEKYVSIDSIFKVNEMIDVIGITKGHGFTGVVKRWGTRILPRKTHRGVRKVACIGAWHPERVSYSVARAGPHGYFHRAQYNNKVYMIGKNANTEEGKFAAKTEFDLTEKGINPMGGFSKYGYVKQDFIMLKGTIAGPAKRVVCLRKSMIPLLSRTAREEIKLKFIDTASKLGTGRFQTTTEKRKFMGLMKKDLERKREEELKKLQQEKGEKVEEKQPEEKSRKKQKQ